MPTIIDYIKDQADRQDKKNIQYEQDILWRIRRAHSKLSPAILSKTRACAKLIDMQRMLNEITTVYDEFNSAVIQLLRFCLIDYAKTAYNNIGDLIELGKEVSGNLSEGIQEQRKLVYSEDILNIIKDNAFKLIKGKSNEQIEAMRRELTNMVLAGTATKQNVRDMIEKVLDADKSYAELVAQTELSTVYNMGTIKRLKEYKKMSGGKMQKYWHGFKYSDNTCEYCRPRIGGIYELEDESETLPAHPRCRCAWLPYDPDWDNSARPLILRANMLNTSYSPEMIYDRINNRLGINYAKYMSKEAASDYLAGDRTTKVIDAIQQARQAYIDNLIEAFNISKDTTSSRMSQEFNQQMDFWKSYVASNMADGNQSILDNCMDAIKGVMLLPWNAEQMDKWNQLLSKINGTM